jgi:hypothetical protein
MHRQFPPAGMVGIRAAVCYLKKQEEHPIIMQLAEFKKYLSQHLDKNIQFILPTGTKIPFHAHVTDVARIEKRYIDCGGTFRTELLCRLQIWFADDTGHRVSARTLFKVLEKAAPFLETEELDIDVEYEAPFISQFPVSIIESTGDVLTVRLAIRHTTCLAPDRCLPPSLPAKINLLNPITDALPSKCCS